MSGPVQILVDGEPCAGSWPLDRALQYGDGLFETMLVRRGRIRFEAEHVARLTHGCERLGIAADVKGIWDGVHRLAARQGEALLKLQLTRGDALARGYAPTGNERARTILSVFPAPQATELPARPAAVTLRSRLGENPQLAGLKHCNRLEQVLARQELAATGAFEGLMGSSSGLLISGTMSNVFLELDGEIVTPALDRCGVAGVARSVALREALRLDMPHRVARLPLEALARCGALAVSNARLGLLEMHELDGRPLAGSVLLRKLAARVDSLEA